MKNKKIIKLWSKIAYGNENAMAGRELYWDTKAAIRLYRMAFRNGKEEQLKHDNELRASVMRTVQEARASKLIRSMDDFERKYFPTDYARKAENRKHIGEPGRCPDCGAALPRVTVIMPR